MRPNHKILVCSKIFLIFKSQFCISKNILIFYSGYNEILHMNWDLDDFKEECAVSFKVWLELVQ